MPLEPIESSHWSFPRVVSVGGAVRLVLGSVTREPAPCQLVCARPQQTSVVKGQEFKPQSSKFTPLSLTLMAARRLLEYLLSIYTSVRVSNWLCSCLQ